ncbi:MAG TPA: hypothetical protein VK171_11510, partial [Fimbriimonas sp.]|nr:hypothetical protein [Fimbriimonas sp.]
LAAISAQDQALMLDLLRYHQELRKAPVDKLPSADIKDLKITERELEMAKQLVASMEAEWNPESYKDEYRKSLMDWINKSVKSHGATPLLHADDEEAEETEVIDMMALLKKSMEERAKPKPTPKRKKA